MHRNSVEEGEVAVNRLISCDTFACFWRVFMAHELWSLLHVHVGGRYVGKQKVKVCLQKIMKLYTRSLRAILLGLSLVCWFNF